MTHFKYKIYLVLMGSEYPNRKLTYTFYNSSAGENSEASTQPELSDELFKQVTSLLQLVRSSSAKSSEAYALFMDELSAVVSKGQLNNKVEVGYFLKSCFRHS